jgi:hypothetical protein
MENCKKCKYENFKCGQINDKIHVIKKCILCNKEKYLIANINSKNINYKEYNIPESVFDEKLGF